MAKVVVATWFPRTYLNLFETYSALDKVNLQLDEKKYSTRGVSFVIKGYKGYPDIRFTQRWHGLHYFTVELPDDGIGAKAEAFMKEMQNLLLEKILRVCHTVTYRNIVSDYMPLDFDIVVLTNGFVDTTGYTVKEAAGLTVAFKPEDSYYGGTITYIMGTEDLDSVKMVVRFYSFTQIAFDFLNNMMKALIRLFHNADALIADIESAKDEKELMEAIKALEATVEECSSRRGKMKHVLLNLKLREEELARYPFSQKENALVEALGVVEWFKHLEADGSYMEILWGDIMESKLRNIQSKLDVRLGLRKPDNKKGWF